MIKLERFEEIKNEVEQAVKELFEFAKNNQKDKNDYYLFLANCCYVPKEDDKIKYIEDYSEYIIDYSIDRLIDIDRINFLTKYINSYYSFSSLDKTTDELEAVTIEMMIYTHIWEADNFLKQLKQISNLCLNEEYDWKVKAPNSENGESKQKFIREELRDKFKEKGLKIAEVMTKGYRSQLRNAFAHCNYSFFKKGRIDLHNFKPNSYEKKSITFNEWTEYFCYSFLFNYFFLNHYYTERGKIKSQIEVFLRNKDGEKEKGILIYNSLNKSFNAKFLER
ncbi:hypothetical protein RCZ04_10120 [Capnocytophaga sp. HP1101]